MINEKAARALGYEPAKAVGAVIHWDKPYTIVGVVRDCHHRSLKDPIEPIPVLIIAISSLGLIGLAAFTAKRRTKERGIRKVLGASVASLFLHLSAEYLWLVVIALVIATPVSWMTSHRWLEEFAFRISPGWSVWIGAGLLCWMFSFLTVSFHALRTAFVNVVRQLRTE